MITGDAPLTAHHVAREVNICTQTAQPALLLTTEGAAAGAGAVPSPSPRLAAAAMRRRCPSSTRRA